MWCGRLGMRHVTPLTVVVILLMASMTSAQSLQQRIDEYRQRQQRQAAEPPAQGPSMAQRMAAPMGSVNFQETPARQAFNWWARAADVPLVINWDQLNNEGVSPDTPVRLTLNGVSAQVVLRLMMQQVAIDVTLVDEIAPWYVRVMTRAEALRRPSVRIYEIMDLTVRVPNFNNAPRMDLQSALSGGGTGGAGGGGGGAGIFGDTGQQDERDREWSREDIGEQIAQMIRDNIEPDVWVENGGTCTVRYFEGRLVVSAPQFVQRQIGVAVPGTARPKAVGAGRGSTISGVQQPTGQSTSTTQTAPAHR